MVLKFPPMASRTGPAASTVALPVLTSKNSWTNGCLFQDKQVEKSKNQTLMVVKVTNMTDMAGSVLM